MKRFFIEYIAWGFMWIGVYIGAMFERINNKRRATQ